MSLFDSLDREVALYAAFMSLTISLLLTVRHRNQERLAGLPLSPFATIIPDVALGTLTGVWAALVVPAHVPALNNITGIGFVAGAGGVLGPKLWDLISSDGLTIALKAAAASIAGPLGSLAKAAAEAGKPAEPAPPLPPATYYQEVTADVAEPFQPDSAPGDPREP